MISEWLGARCPIPPLQVGVYPSTPARLYLAAIVPGNAAPGECGISREAKWLLPLATDRWMDFVLHVKWSSDPAVGYVELWQDRIRRIPKMSLATLYPGGDSVYFKHGFYRASSPFTNVVYNDEFRRVASLRELPRSFVPAEASSGATSMALLRRTIERSGQSWERFLRARPGVARAGGVVGLDWAGKRIYTKPYVARYLELRGVAFDVWRVQHPTAAVKLDLKASDTPYAVIVGRPQIRRGALHLKIRSALALTVSTAALDSKGRLVAWAESRMAPTGMLDQRLKLGRRHGRQLTFVVRTIRGDDAAVVRKRFTVR